VSLGKKRIYSYFSVGDLAVYRELAAKKAKIYDGTLNNKN
jgi:hypothetical protein